MEYISSTFVLFTFLLIPYTRTQIIYPQMIAEHDDPNSAKLDISSKSSAKVQHTSPAIVNLNLIQNKGKKPLGHKSISLNSTYNKTQPIVVTNKTTQSEETVDTDQTISEIEEKAGELGPGAIGRAVVVFVLVSLVFLLYVGIKTCRRKTVDKSKTFVHRKYGVRTTRSDMEMEPLPLSDDEEDNTIFDSRLNLISERGPINK